MNLRTVLLIAFALLTAKCTLANDDLKYMKTTVDAMAIKDALYVLTSSGNNPVIEVYEDRLDSLLIALENLGTGYRKDTYPIDLLVTDQNRSRIGEICAELTTTMSEVRQMIKIVENQFVVDKQDLLLTFQSDHPGDYYTGINPDFQYFLYNHPFRDKLEQIQLQDIGFVEFMASGDSSLWHMGRYCPNLKSIVMFAAEIGDNELVNLNLNEVTNLTALELSENRLAKLPADFNANNSLKFLSLRRNNLTKMPTNIGNWTNLVYLDLSNNSFSVDEQERIKLALPNAVIKF